MERCRHVSSPRPAIGDNFPKGAKSRQLAQLQSHVRYRGSLVSITDVCCRPSTCQLSGEEQAATPEVVFPRAGVFVRHIGNQEVLAKANHVLFFNHLLIRNSILTFINKCGHMRRIEQPEQTWKRVHEFLGRLSK